jgi:hypothetical protein
VGLNCSVRNGKRCFPHAKATEIVKTGWPPAPVHPGATAGAHTRGPSKLHSLPTSGYQNPSSPRPISTGLLRALLRLQIRPINLVVYQGSYSLKEMGELILRSASRLDAFSGYPIRT